LSIEGCLCIHNHAQRETISVDLRDHQFRPGALRDGSNNRQISNGHGRVVVADGHDEALDLLIVIHRDPKCGTAQSLHRLTSTGDGEAVISMDHTKAGHANKRD